jgi:two-component sensor histidine kinase
LDAKPRQAEDEPDYLKELLAQAGIDAQASSVAAKLQEVVIGELQHRMKNTDTLRQSIADRKVLRWGLWQPRPRHRAAGSAA